MPALNLLSDFKKLLHKECTFINFKTNITQ